MKFRKSFVTNSSSSSYICDICGEEASGWDLSLSEAEMYECEHGHTFCETHLRKNALTKETLIDFLKNKMDEEDWQNYNIGDIIDDFDELYEVAKDWDLRYECSEKICPICSFEKFLDSDLLKYIQKYKGINLDEIKNEVKNKYNSYSSFIEDMK